MAKRAAGEGSVFRRGNRWVAQVGSGSNRKTGISGPKEKPMNGDMKRMDNERMD